MPRVIISEPGTTPQPYRFKLERNLIKIGRGSDNDIVIKCGSVSTDHCYMERVEGGYVMRDKGSTNGIKLNDTPMEAIDLYDGTEVLVGDIPVTFQLTDDELETLSHEEFTSHQKKKLPPVDEAPTSGRISTSSPRATHANRPQPTLQKSSSPFRPLLVFILLLLALSTGLTLRHLKRTGDFLPSKLMGGTPQEKPEGETDASSKEEEESNGTGDEPVTDSEM